MIPRQFALPALAGATLAALLACGPRSSKEPALTSRGHEPRCFRDGVPPPKRIAADHTLIALHDRGEGCPYDRPDGQSCSVIPKQDATDVNGRPVESWRSCYYENPDSPCDPYQCSCDRRTRQGVVCGIVIID